MLKYSNISSGESSIPDYMQRQSSVGMTKSCLIFNIKWKNICCSIQRTLATVINLNRLCCTEFTSNSKISGTQKKIILIFVYTMSPLMFSTNRSCMSTVWIICCPPKFICWCPIFYIWNNNFKEVINVKWGHKGVNSVGKLSL